MTGTRTLLIGYGNPGRGDDGLGPAFAQNILQKDLPGLSVEIDFQLSADHALLISRNDTVIFADALVGSTQPFQFSEIGDQVPNVLGSHSVTPEVAVALSRLLFDAMPRAFLLGVAGSEFGKMEESLSALARSNLALAEAFFVNWYQVGDRGN